MDVVVLAGARNKGALREASDCPYEAGIEVAGQTLLAHVVRSLPKVTGIDRIAVVAPDECISEEIRAMIWRSVSGGEDMVDSLRHGLAVLNPKGKVLIVTADIPLITAEAIDDFLTRCGKREADVYYPIVARETIEERFPGVKRTYAKMREGVFTGGNIVLLAPEIVERHLGLIVQAVELRKKPLKMGRMLGMRQLILAVIGRLSIAAIERRIEKNLHFRGAAIVTPYAEIGIDVDKPSDLALVRRVLES